MWRRSVCPEEGKTGEKDLHPQMKKDGEVILFLKQEASRFPFWVTVDPWFGVQSVTAWLPDSLKRLAAEMAAGSK